MSAFAMESECMKSIAIHRRQKRLSYFTLSYFLLVAKIKPFIRDCYILSLKFFKNFDYR